MHIPDKLVVIVNEKNLIVPSPSQARENGRKGGIKSGETRRRKRNLKAALKAVLALPVQDTDKWNALSALGVDPADIDNQTAIVCALMSRAMAGDVAAFKEIRSLLGEDNDAQRVKLQKQELKLKEQKQDGAGSDGRLAELIEGLKDDIHE